MSPRASLVVLVLVWLTALIVGVGLFGAHPELLAYSQMKGVLLSVIVDKAVDGFIDQDLSKSIVGVAEIDPFVILP